MDSDKEKAVLAVDIGGSKYLVGIVDDQGKILFQKRWKWESYGQASIRAALMEAVDQVLAIPHLPPVKRGGMTIPGLADRSLGLWVSTQFMGISDYPIARDFQEAFGLPFFLENDGRACVLAERRFGAGQDCDSFLYITISNGVGGGLFLNGKVLTGAYGNAGEVGQIIVQEGGRLSDDGRAGTLEMYAATAGLVQTYLELGGSEDEEGKVLNGARLATLADRGDEAAREAFRLEGYYLGKAIAAANNLLDLEKVILGGGLSLAFRHFAPSLRETVTAQTFERAYTSPLILTSPLGYESALLGAAVLALEGENQRS